MDRIRFDHLTRALTRTPTRRDVARALSGLALGGALGPIWHGDISAKKKKKRKKCRPCQIRKKGKCKGNKPDDAACNGDGKCFAGQCVPRPTCLGYLGECQDASPCCSEVCVAGQFCLFSNFEQPCLGPNDCSTVPFPLQCVGYRCRQP